MWLTLWIIMKCTVQRADIVYCKIHNTALYLGMAADVTGRLHVGDAIISVDGVDLRYCSVADWSDPEPTAITSRHNNIQ